MMQFITKENLDRALFFSTEIKTYKCLEVLYIRIFSEKNSKKLGALIF